MPVIAKIDGAVIRMYFGDHNPPHVHVTESGGQAKVEIATGLVMIGKLRPATERKVRRWVTANRDDLMARWDENQQS
jgi:hypothetical protein